jgi:Family of unknown function (DUF6130)
MKRVALLLLLGAAAVGGIVAANAPPSGRAEEGPSAQTARDSASVASAREVRGANPYIEVDQEPAPKLIVDEPDTNGLAKGLVWIQYRTENVRILPVFGKAALDVSPRIGHLHIHVDDLPWLWAESSGINTIDIGGMPPGAHKVLIELVDANHQAFPGQAKTVKFTVPKSASASH